jgi:geranylgeranyl diphosphate synthase type 3
VDNSIFRRGVPAAHTIYGFSSTMNAASYLLLIWLKKVHGLNHPEAMTLCMKRLSEMYQGQGMDIYWRDNYTCPILKEYQDMAKKSKDKIRTLSTF